MNPVLQRLLAAIAAGLASLLCGSALAAGGHFDVDDAAMLEPGQCQLELWQLRSRGRAVRHAGPACHLAGVELALNLDRQDRLNSWGPQIKWVAPINADLAWGVVVAANWQGHGAGLGGTSLLLPLSWQAHPRLLVHLNLGRDFSKTQADTTRRGVAAEWTLAERWTLLAEHLDDGRHAHQRAGLRWQWQDCCSLDFSRSRLRGDPAASAWGVGLNWAFQR